MGKIKVLKHVALFFNLGQYCVPPPEVAVRYCLWYGGVAVAHGVGFSHDGAETSVRPLDAAPKEAGASLEKLKCHRYFYFQLQLNPICTAESPQADVFPHKVSDEKLIMSNHDNLPLYVYTNKYTFENTKIVCLMLMIV